MLPLGLVLLVATAAPQQSQSYELKSGFSQPRINVQRLVQQSPLEAERSNVCFTMRSYYFHRQDGQAPVLVGTSTCTPASKLQQKRVSPEPGAVFVPLGLQIVPLGLQSDGQK
jgi:hypothetical protein